MHWIVVARQFAAYLCLRVVICLIQSLRMETCQQLSRALATLFTRVLPFRRSLVEENLRLAMPELSATERRKLAWRMWEHLFLLVCEVGHAPRKIHETNWRDYVTLFNTERLTRRLLDDRPLLVVSGHFGNFELAGFFLGMLGFPTYTVARTIDNPFMDAFVNRFRGTTGQHIVAKKGGFDQILNVLASGGTMTFLADQYAGSKGCWIEFFGRPASAHKAVALLALEHQAPMIIGSARRRGKPLHFELGAHGEADPRDGGPMFESVTALTQWYTTELETLIRGAPDQYWWVHRRWKDNRGNRWERRKAKARMAQSSTAAVTAPRKTAAATDHDLPRVTSSRHF